MNLLELTVQYAEALHEKGFDLVIENGEVVRYEKDVDMEDLCYKLFSDISASHKLFAKLAA